MTDKAPSLGSAFRKLQSVGLYTKTEHRTVKYLNNLIEQDHQPIKRRNKFYQSLRTASSTIKGMETIRGIYKKNRRNGTLFGFSVSTEIKVLMGIPAYDIWSSERARLIFKFRNRTVKKLATYSFYKSIPQ